MASELERELEAAAAELDCLDPDCLAGNPSCDRRVFAATLRARAAHLRRMLEKYDAGWGWRATRDICGPIPRPEPSTGEGVACERFAPTTGRDWCSRCGRWKDEHGTGRHTDKGTR
jgi:hypothetical protein